MRIASLVPSATELAFALGLGSEVVAVTHECDHPAEVANLPRLTRSVIEPGLEPAAIDAAVRERTESGEALYELDERLLAELDVDLIVTQELCAVCAVSYEDVAAVAARLPSKPAVLSLDPTTLGEVLADAGRLAGAAGRPQLGPELERSLRERIEAVRAAVSAADRPRVAALEWLDPPYAAGHWLPEMIEAAGGIDVLAETGSRSRQIEWSDLDDARPEVVVVMPCGLYCEEAAAEARRHTKRLQAAGPARVHAVDAASSFSRPGPRLADGVELLGHLLHPEILPAPPGLASEAITLGDS
jgi:iron complex transport system substrate-binding protein